jgi:hypothetical protein
MLHISKRDGVLHCSTVPPQCKRRGSVAVGDLLNGRLTHCVNSGRTLYAVWRRERSWLVHSGSETDTLRRKRPTPVLRNASKRLELAR